jgi:hypothetical protein
MKEENKLCSFVDSTEDVAVCKRRTDLMKTMM